MLQQSSDSCLVSKYGGRKSKGDGQEKATWQLGSRGTPGSSAVTWALKQGFLTWAPWTLVKIPTHTLDISYTNSVSGHFMERGSCSPWILRRVSAQG